MRSMWALTILLLLANLLVPQQIVRYKPCCYDSDGQLSACARFRTQNGAEIKGEDCCAPRVISLRAGNSAPTLQPTVIAGSSANDDVISDAATMPLQFSIRTTLVLVSAYGCDAGPPWRDILALHSRLNL